MQDEAIPGVYAKPGRRITVNIPNGKKSVSGCRISSRHPGVTLEPVVAGVAPSAVEIAFARVATQFGNCLVASTADAICFLEFAADDEQPALQRLQSIWPGVPLRRAANLDWQLEPLLAGTGSVPAGCICAARLSG